MAAACRSIGSAGSARLGGIGPSRAEAGALEALAPRLLEGTGTLARRAVEILGEHPFGPAPLEAWFEAHLTSWIRGLLEARFGRRFLLSRLELARIHSGLGLRMCDLLSLSEAVRIALAEEITVVGSGEPRGAVRALAGLHRLCDLDILIWLHLRSDPTGGCEATGASACGSLAGWVRPTGSGRGGSLALILDHAGKIAHFDSAAEALTGWSAGEVLGKGLEILAGESIPIPHGCRDAGAPVAFRPLPLVTKGGAHHLVRWTAIPCGDEADGEILLVGRDVTEEQHRVLETWSEARRASVGHLAAGIAHAIGNMASSISSVLQTLQRKVQDPYVLEKSRIMGTHVDRITEVLQKMVDLGRPPSRDWRKKSVSEILGTALDYVSLDKRIRRTDLQVSLDPGTVPVSCMEDYLLEALLSILLFCLEVAESQVGPERLELEVRSWALPGAAPGAELTLEARKVVLDADARARWLDARQDGIPFPDHPGLVAGRQILGQHGGRVEFSPVGADGFRFHVRIEGPDGKAPP